MDKQQIIDNIRELAKNMDSSERLELRETIFGLLKGRRGRPVALKTEQDRIDAVKRNNKRYWDKVRSLRTSSPQETA